MAKLVLLTGLMGSGKSTVAKILREKGYVVHDTDSMTKKLYDKHYIKSVLSDLFGSSAFMEWPEDVPEYYMRTVNFDYLKLKFFDRSYRDEALKLSTALLKQFYSYYDLHNVETDKEFIFVEAAPVYHLYSFIMHYNIDTFVTVECNVEDRCKHLRERGLTNDEIEQRSAMQHELVFLDNNYMIKNDGDVDKLKESVDTLLELLKMQNKD